MQSVIKFGESVTMSCLQGAIWVTVTDFNLGGIIYSYRRSYRYQHNAFQLDM